MPSPGKIPRRALDGVLLLDKGVGLSSNAALQRAKRLFQAAKAGHTGTLDPLATGLLPICFGEATKFSSDLLEADKSYDAVITLGVLTDTQDAEGRVVQRNAVEVDQGKLDAVLAGFRGEIQQLPPMYSALKHQGRPLYSYAREGTEIARSPRKVTIYGLSLTKFAGDRVHITVDCSKGTYIRTLAQDIGAALGCGAHLAGLRRTRVGSLTIGRALTLETLEQMAEAMRDGTLLPVDSLVSGLPVADLDSELARRFGHGQTVELASNAPPGETRVYSEGCFLGVGTVDVGGSLMPRRLVVEPAKAQAA